MQDLILRGAGEMTTRNTITIPEPVVSRSFHQLGIFVNDGSGSMADPALNGMAKSLCVGMATADTFSRFQGSTKRSNFSFAIVDFDDSAKQRMEITEAAVLDPYQDYTPLPPGSGGTSIAAGLEQAEQIAKSFFTGADGDVMRSVVIVVLSDGRDGSPTETLQIATRLKAQGRITLCACLLATRGGHDAEAEAHLRTIASDPLRNYRTVYDPETIRGFFVASLSAGTKL